METKDIVLYHGSLISMTEHGLVYLIYEGTPIVRDKKIDLSKMTLGDQM